MPREFEKAGEQQEQKGEECQALAPHQVGKRPSEREGGRRATGGGRGSRNEKKKKEHGAAKVKEVLELRPRGY